MLRALLRVGCPQPVALSSVRACALSTKRHAGEASSAGVLVEHDEVDGQRTGVVLVTLNRPDKVRALIGTSMPASFC